MSPVYLNPSPVVPSSTSSSFPFLEIKDSCYPANTNISQAQLHLTHQQASSFMIPHHQHHPHPSAAVAGGSTTHHNISQDHFFISKQQRENDDQLKFINFQTSTESLNISSNPVDQVVPAQPYLNWSLKSTDEINYNVEEDGMEIDCATVTQLEDGGAGEVIDDGAAFEISSSSSSRSTSSKWMPSKMRMIQKMAANNSNTNNKSNTNIKPSGTVVRIRHRSSHRVQHENNSSNTNVRQCSDCHTTTTPLWRSGPQGPKTLCNACGIRQRKARQAMVAAAAAGTTNGSGSSIINTNNTIHMGFSSKSTNNHHKVHHKAERAAAAGGTSDHHNKSGNHHHLLPYKKRGKPISHKQQHQQLSFEEFAFSLTNSLGSTSSRGGNFPRDEEEGAILLMALSCGLA